MRWILVLALLLGTAGPLWAQHGGHGGHGGHAASEPDGRGGWTPQPLLIVERNEDRASAMLRIRGLQAPSVTVFGPGGGHREFPLTDGRARIEVADAGTGNYQWVQIRDEQAGRVVVASTAWFSPLTGPAPRRLLATPHSELEIVPALLPREHAFYRESEKWGFLVRYQGQPLAGQPLLLETENGSRIGLVTDAQGMATVVFPRDFGDKPDGSGAAGGHVVAGFRGDRIMAGFVLSTEYVSDARHFVTAFNSTYGVDAGREHSLGWGAAFGVLGMASALPLLRRRKRIVNKEPSC
ncbi:MAG: hypothetical protein LBI48_12680 [Burkholderiaceae bacterium]|jgi:hypothetical protein|nr:hypothetical protein [Burkholderiaceae bacterium]